jgi:DNA mismatch repair protein MutL
VSAAPGRNSVRRAIQRLDPATVERIAAGEVVERPASVVKELVENAIDAGATSVTIVLEAGGTDRLEVSDDGSGIPAGELALALERHATSKIDPVGPIDRIASLGFRGEALAAIATVSRLRLVSRPAEAEHATGLTDLSGALGSPFAAARAVGTTVEVSDLFFNTPARRKFLKSPAVEQLEVLRTVERLYLAQPSVSFRVLAEDREIAQYPAETNLHDAAARVLGSDLLGAACPIEAEIPGGRVVGVVGRPSLAAPTSRRLFLSVNGRAVESRSLAQAVRLGFGEFLPRTRYPIGVLHLEIDPERIDVNVDPTKRTVRFAREREVADALRLRVREALLDAPRVADLSERTGADVPVAADGPGVLRPFPFSSVRTPAGAQRTLEGIAAGSKPTAVPAAPGRPALVLLGCLDALYWVATSEEGLLIIDQHAASERVVFDFLRRHGAFHRQILVEPITIRLSGAQRATLAAHEETVRLAGFGIEPFGPDDVRLRSVPSYRGKWARPDSLLGLLDELAEGGRPTVPDGLAERMTATIACHSSIRGGEVVTPEEFVRVLRALYELPEASYACPHGRPIAVRVPRGRLDRWFLRSGT